MAEKNKQGNLKVIIVGGSIAGLVLAHSLHRAGIDFVVLEARNRIDPQLGASIGFFANGARVLDQLGVYDDIEKHIQPPRWVEIVTGEGTLVQKVDTPELMQARMGYPIAFLERQQVIRLLFNHIPDPTKVHIDKKVVSVDHLADGVVVHCEDGSQFTGDIVAGADGVHSKIRREMWRHAERGNGLRNLAKDKKAMSSDYRCLFGISYAVPGLDVHTHYRAFNEDWSFLVIPGKGDRCFWFVFEKLDRTYHTSDIPRYTEADELDFVKPFIKRYISQHVTFGAVWERKICTSLTALQEAQFSHWAFDRFVCLGDSIHKMTPNIGQGGNWAIESAAALANNLDIMNKSCDRARPSIDHIRRALGEYERGRRVRTKNVGEIASFAIRLETFSKFWHKLMVMHLVPASGDLGVDVFCQAVLEGARLNFLPLPAKSLLGRTPSHGAQPSLIWRVFRALPLLGLFFAAHLVLGTTIPRVFTFSGDSPTPGNQTSQAQTAVFQSMEWINTHAFLPPVNGLNHAERRQVIGFMGDLVPLQIIWAIESLRRGNALTFETLSALFGIMGQWKGIGYVAPIYYFFHYVQSPLDKYVFPDNRLVPTNYVKTLSAAVVIGYILPTICAFLGFSIEAHQYINGVWQLFPVWTTVLHRVLASSASDTTVQDRIKNPRADMPYLRRVYAFAAVVSAIAYLYLWTTATSSAGYVLPGTLLFQGGVMPVTAGFGQLMKYNQLFTFGSGFIWQLLHFSDLKKSGRLNATWAKVIGVLTSTALLFGPGAAMAVGWAWREEALARKIGDVAEKQPLIK